MALSATLIVLGYRQEAFISQAIESAFAQEYDGPLEILLSDDGSPDATWEIMLDLVGGYDGPHEITVNRMEKNVGMIGHFSAAVKRARGEIVTYLAGDDIAAPERVACCAALLSARPDLSFVESAYQPFTRVVPEAMTGPDGFVSFSLEDYTTGHCPDLSSSTRCFRRELFLDYPDLDTALSSEDSPAALRLLMRGDGARLHRSLLFKRVHDANITGIQGLKKIDFDRIGTQYLCDVEFARAREFITAAQSRRVQAWAPRNIERRKLRLLFDLDYPSTSQLWRHILPSTALGPREKFYALRRWAFGLAVRDGSPQ